MALASTCHAHSFHKKPVGGVMLCVPALIIERHLETHRVQHQPPAEYKMQACRA